VFLLRAGAAEADYEAGCQPDVVLVSAEAAVGVVDEGDVLKGELNGRADGC